ncbi:MAG TPA: chemotaxis protein CheW [Syntrophales bacterium]|nr:chemotaxis protein CheW [Syntrophales bacterium]HPQ42965.1 chemotaxis protein CheW [Syntrophales bacterium]
MKEVSKLVIFHLGNKPFALPVPAVQRIIRAVEVTAVPKAPEIVTGIINLHGMFIPVFNIRMRFQLPPKDMDLDDQMIIATTAKRTIALIVDSVDDVIEVSKERIITAEKVLPELEYVKGIIKTEDGMILIHDLERFLSLSEEETLDEAMETIQGSEKENR